MDKEIQTDMADNNIYKIVEEEINEKLGYMIIPCEAHLFNNNIIFFLHANGNMYFNKNMLLDLFSDSSNKLLIYNYIQSENNIWPLDFLKAYKYSYKPITINDIPILHRYKENKIFKYFYFIDVDKNNWFIHTSNKYRNHVIYIKSVNDLFSYLQKILSKSKKSTSFKNYKHEELIDICCKDKNLFMKYINIVYLNNSIYEEIEINNYINSLDSLRHILSNYNLTA